jgi:hypothetical protein
MMSTYCSKHVEAWNKYIKKECVKLVINQNYQIYICAHILYRNLSRSDEVYSIHATHHLRHSVKYFFQCADFLQTYSYLAVITWKSPAPNITQNGRQVWNARVEILLCPYVACDCSWVIFTRLALLDYFYEELLHQISWKSDKQLSRWHTF